MRVISAIVFACIVLLTAHSHFDSSSTSSSLFAMAKQRDRWYSVTDEATGRIYFWNKATGETTWKRPKDVKVKPGVRYHKQKNNRKNVKTAAPPKDDTNTNNDASAPKSKRPRKGPGSRKSDKRRAAEAEAAAAAAAEEAEANANADAGAEFELLDDEGDLIPPPPPAIAYALIAAGVGALALVIAVVVYNARKDSAMMDNVYKKRS